jgi:hypothetical protein
MAMTEAMFSPEESLGYLIGIALALGVSTLATLARFDRDRAFYPTLPMIIVSYYVLFAVMGGFLAWRIIGRQNPAT